MRDAALFLNGVYESVLQEILGIQAYLPEQILYLQPFSSNRIVELAKRPPSVEEPVRLFISTTEDLPTVRYVCEIVGWEDKRELAGWKLNAINRVLFALQPNEGGVYGLKEPEKPDMVNLLCVRRMRKLSKPFSVAELINARSGGPLSTNRSQAGGWVYVVNPDQEWLSGYL
jgi:hypothetical protein